MNVTVNPARTLELVSTESTDIVADVGRDSLDTTAKKVSIVDIP